MTLIASIHILDGNMSQTVLKANPFEKVVCLIVMNMHF